jgi:ABC-type lipoprotein export system ATPase subunit
MIVAENLNKIFYQGDRIVHAVKDAGLRIGAGERVLIHGPSGAGKSTLLHVLAGLDRPTSGSVGFRGKEVYRLSDRKRSALRNGCFGFVFQFYHLLPELNVLENVMLPAMIKGGERGKEMKRRAVSLLKGVGLADRLKHRPSQLSGGESQRTAIARSLMNYTDVLFCDEPAGNLDSEMSEEIYSIIRSISEERGMSVVVVSHQAVADDFPHTKYCMKDGVLSKAGEGQAGEKEIRAAKTLKT